MPRPREGTNVPQDLTGLSPVEFPERYIVAATYLEASPGVCQPAGCPVLVRDALETVLACAG